MNILDRIKIALFRRELRALEAADREMREARTTHDMMVKIIEDTTRIIDLQNRIREIEGEPDEAQTDFDDTRPPSDMFIPTEGNYK